MNKKMEDYACCIEYLLEGDDSEAIKQDNKSIEKENNQSEEPELKLCKQIRISISQSDAIKLRFLLILPGLSIRKRLRKAVADCIKKQYEKNKKQIIEEIEDISQIWNL